MDQVTNLLLGLGVGAVIAALAIGVVLTYRASGVVNFRPRRPRHVHRLRLHRSAHHGRPRAAGSMGLVAHTHLTAGIQGHRVWCVLRHPHLGDSVRHHHGLRPRCWAGALRARVPPAADGADPRQGRRIGRPLPLLLLHRDLQSSVAGVSRALEPDILPTMASVLGVVIPQNRLWLTGLVLLATARPRRPLPLHPFGLATRAASERREGRRAPGSHPIPGRRQLDAGRPC